MRRPGACVAVVALAIALAGAPARATDELTTILQGLEQAGDSGARRELVIKLAQQPWLRAAEHLRKLVRTDPDPAIRIEAANGLGKSVVPECTDFLLQLVLEGGPREVRRAIARSIAKRNARDRMMKVFDKQDDDRLARGLILEALVEDPSLEAAETLERLCRSEDQYVRCEALRAMSHHPAGKANAPAVLRAVLKKRQDFETVLAGLDVAESLADADFRTIVDMLDTFLEPEVQGAVEAARRRLAYLDALDAARKAAGPQQPPQPRDDGYAHGKNPYGEAPLPEPPPPRPRVDTVYVYDATGSVTGHLPLIKQRILREADTLARIGADFRIGIVAYRDNTVRRGLWCTKELPLTYDVAKAGAFIDEIGTGGCDSQGASITQGLEQAMNRMVWRWTATRQVALVADSRVGVADECKACQQFVKLHYQADHTRVNVWYLYRTRTQLPPSVEAIAHVGGGIVESLE